MLNISNQKINLDKSLFKSFGKVSYVNAGKTLSRFLIGTALIAFVILFLPWTQNINSTGKVTTLYLDERPQSINTAIAGRIEEWYVREGQFVHAGDPIIRLSEIKDDYLDPQVIQRTQKQLNAKQSTIESYEDKVNALENQKKTIVVCEKRTALEVLLNALNEKGLNYQCVLLKDIVKDKKVRSSTSSKYIIFS